MEPSGKLYVPGAKDVAPAMERLVDAARAARLVHVASADDHELTDPEISDDARPPEHVPAALPARHARRREDPRDEAARPAAALARSRIPPGPRPRADRGPPRDPAPEEELRRLHEPEHRAAARRARPRRDRRLRRRDRRLQQRGDPRLPPARPPRPLRRGRLPRPRRGPNDRLHGRLARPRRRVHDRRGGDRLTRLRDSRPRCR